MSRESHLKSCGLLTKNNVKLPYFLTFYSVEKNSNYNYELTIIIINIFY